MCNIMYNIRHPVSRKGLRVIESLRGFIGLLRPTDSWWKRMSLHVTLQIL